MTRGVLAPCPASREHKDPRSAEPGTLTRPPRPPRSLDALSLTGELVGRTPLRQLCGAPFAIVGAGPLMGGPFRRYSPRDRGSSTSAAPLAIDLRLRGRSSIGTTVSFGRRTGAKNLSQNSLGAASCRVPGYAGHFLGMVVTLPLSRRGRLTLAWTRTGGFQAAAWRAEPRCGLFPEGDDGRGSAGVREPRRPRPPRLDGAVAVPLDDEPTGATF
jgi:hypothetical protein